MSPEVCLLFLIYKTGMQLLRRIFDIVGYIEVDVCSSLRWWFFLHVYIFLEKKYTIADLEITVDDEKHLDVCVIAHNWMSEEGENCVYSTYLTPKKQGKKCMKSTAKFNTYSATIRAWFGKIL